ncbi:ATPase [Carboxylicivirga sp. N1E11]|uniref:ATPase n=1 Tax=Carboxylicivirga longa TaxID=3134029 RepID=UPI003D359AE6
MIENRQPIEKCITKGINPFYQTSSEILQNLMEEYTLNYKKPQTIYFYGAGCANEEKNNIVKEGLAAYFQGADIHIDSDLCAAARSLCQQQPGIACILGTGSNSCYYDGQAMVNNVSPLGFIIGDEGSGAVLGKKLIGDLLKNQLPESVRKHFFETYSTTQAEILDHIYKQGFPNRYLAQYTRFLAQHIEKPEIESLVTQAFCEFIERNLLQYEQAASLPIHFTGSIAYYFKNQLKKALIKYNLKLGSITQAPMEGLIQYHTALKH